MFTAKIREKSIGKMRSMRLLAVFLVPVVALVLGAASPPALASGWTIEECEEGLDESQVFFEFNSTDCDLGIQIFWDGEPWKYMIVKDKRGRSVLNVFPRSSWREVGLTEGFFEGAEPPLIDVDEGETCDLNDDEILELIDEFIKQFKAGQYTFKGMAAEERCLLLGDAELTYDILTPAEFTDTSLPIIGWNHPTGLVFGGTPQVVGYEMVVELVVEASDEQVFKETTTLPGDATSYTVSDTFMDLITNLAGDIVELKIEILADEESGNRTITEHVLIAE